MGQDGADSLNVIRANHANNMECCSRMFTEWRQRMATASWQQLIEALREIRLGRLASELEGLISPVGSASQMGSASQLWSASQMGSASQLWSASQLGSSQQHPKGIYVASWCT